MATPTATRRRRALANHGRGPVVLGPVDGVAEVLDALVGPS
jgi:hypothetical protein